ncbi:hypothetical protein BST81_12940 [Leptolyngbya sp. 'hensonii']|uniref:GGDEF domain-containing response regulator n=1 Tax=Leptolyngbya sp. 'hensonii' TaxID=1922337 RepID=UPI000950088B|nr:response regulator [Leptolyngbya sp. 'hensonii']OLP17953.1 hypothetical protein BST81_12940 [Leptolyngbya sp. 'hensonii']
MENISILIVEDELLIAHNLARMLKKLNYQVVDIVSSGEAAIEVAGEKKPDLVLMDIVIKGQINGIEAALKIQNQYGIPIIYITAYTDSATIRRARETGAYGFMVKPFKKEQLKGTIEVAMGHHQRVVEMLRLVQINPATSILDCDHFLSLAEKDFQLTVQANRNFSVSTTFSVLMMQVDWSNYTLEADDCLFSRALRDVVIKIASLMLHKLDYIGQLNSGEFIIFSPETSCDEMGVVAAQVRQAIADTPIALLGQRTQLTINIGMASYYSDDSSFEFILKRARQDLEKRKYA